MILAITNTDENIGSSRVAKAEHSPNPISNRVEHFFRVKKVQTVVFLLIYFTSFMAVAQQKLFNGKNLNGWEIYGDEKWYVEDGLLICESGPKEEYGYLATKKHYKDFELELDFKQEADGNSGVFIRSTIDGTKISGWQVEIAPPGKDTGGVYESYGRGWLKKIPDEKEDVLQMGEWNHLKIKVLGDNITSWLNGVEMMTLEDEKIGKGEGSIALQIHSGGGIKVLWKDIILRKL